MAEARTAAGKPLSGRSVIVVGGGFGGLSAACYLARDGADVRLVEKNEQVGGRASRLRTGGFTFDMGPSWYLMPDVFERFFGHFDRRPEEYYELERLDPHYRIFWKDGDRIDVAPDRGEMRDLFESYEPGAGEAFEEYLDTAERHYDVAMEQFVYEDRSSPGDFVDLDVMRAAPIGLRLLGTMDDYVADYFEEPKLRQVMQYTLVFLGGAPSNTPALYNIMSHVDFNMGVYYPRPADGEGPGGIGTVVGAVADLAGELGAEITTGAEVSEITRRREGFLVETVDGRSFRPDYVVSDADYAHTEQNLLPVYERQYDADYWASRTYAPSAFLLYLGVEGGLEPLAHHTLVLPTDWDDHFEQIFEEERWPDDPAYYVCVPSETDDAVAPEGHSNLFVLVPIAPGLADDETTRRRYRERVLEDLAGNAGVELRGRIVTETSFCVSDFAERYNAYEGTALGLAHTLDQTAPFRPPHRSEAAGGLYFTGGYTTPGIGVPMCLISGQQAAGKLVEDVTADR
jgi:phytoene desaturase